MDPRGKQPVLNEDPSTAAGLDWRSAFPPTARVLNRALVMQTLYTCYDDSTATMARTTAHLVENDIFRMATDEHDYLTRASQYNQGMPRTPEKLQGFLGMHIPASLKEASYRRTDPLRRLRQRHLQMVFICSNLGNLYNMKISFEQNIPRNQGLSVRQVCLHDALNAFKRNASIDLLGALHHSEIELELRATSGEMINSLEEWHAEELERHLQNFVSTTTYKLDKLSTDELQKYMQWLFNTDHGLYSGFLEDAKDHYRANIPRDYLVALVGSTLNPQQQPLALPSDGNPVMSPQPHLQQLQSVAPVGSNMQQLPMAGDNSDANTILLQQPLAGLPSYSNPTIDDHDINTEGLFDGSTSEAFQNYMLDLQQTPLEVEQQPPAGNLPDINAVPPPEQQPP